ncbi:ribonuclease P protein component [Nocardioides marmoribigeumensis]
MLSRTSRLTSPADFQTAMRGGRRAGSRSLVVHVAVPEGGPEAGEPPRVGFVVSRAVGGAVQRNLVKRRLRHLSREVVAELPAGSLLVVRALPPAAESSYAELREDLTRGVQRVLHRAQSGVRR